MFDISSQLWRLLIEKIGGGWFFTVAARATALWAPGWASGWGFRGKKDLFRKSLKRNGLGYQLFISTFSNPTYIKEKNRHTVWAVFVLRVGVDII